MAGPWTPAVASLMAGLRRAGIQGVPEHLGLDEAGREVVTWVDGEVPVYPMPRWAWDDQVLLDVAHATRAVHDAAAALNLPRTGWRRPAVEPVETVCHGDIAPYNAVFQHGRLVGLIDWDYAVPGPRLWDLGYLAYRFISLTPPGHRDGRPGSGPPAEQWRRVGLLSEAYRGVEPVEVVRWAARRLEDLIAYSYAEAAAGNAVLQGTIDLGHVALYEGDLEWVRGLL
ncbi:MAG: phosphotransferase [Frankiales bacterium]|nr:phosphotransferase [Frankiales bacterium]